MSGTQKSAPTMICQNLKKCAGIVFRNKSARYVHTLATRAIQLHMLVLAPWST